MNRREPHARVTAPRRRLALIALTALTLATQTGCFGKFALVRGVYGVNDKVGSKFLKSFVTWVFVIVPVYAVAGFLDFVIFNTIEFYAGENPIAAGPVTRTYANGNDQVHVTYTKEGGKIIAQIRHERDGKLVKSSRLVDDGVRTEMKTDYLAGDPSDFSATSALRNDDGSVTVSRTSAAGTDSETMKPGAAEALAHVLQRRLAETTLATSE